MAYLLFSDKQWYLAICMDVQYYLGMETLTPSQWIVQCAARLQGRWQTVGPDQLEEVAVGIWQDPASRLTSPDVAAQEWLRPITESEVCGGLI